ncbi:Pr6Pr family membrane protein [Nocardioides sp.]|uniref:Pr6Pr family membrane protein n=1 Tax=Nocardioides sp. TaxID=35761 RepID=UPI00272935A3|nr:Pr6Pr family membrane protein [Nocardioides sp.]MDO9454873.1 Pr6Pr family membrane protein [Nocardioides sp.]
MATFALTAVAAVVGVGLALWVGYHETPVPDPDAGFTTTYGPGWDGLLNQLAYFTTQSSLLVGVTSLLLALRLDRTSTAFHVWRLAGLIDIVITGVVFNAVLAGDDEPIGIAGMSDLLLHKVVPLLAVFGWVLFGPPGSRDRRRVGLALAVPLAYIALTLVRGAVVDWYPYSFFDVDAHGYGFVLAMVGAILVLGLLVAGVLAALDEPLSRWRGARRS